jgi:hypothetical protein
MHIVLVRNDIVWFDPTGDQIHDLQALQGERASHYTTEVEQIIYLCGRN